LKLTRHCASLPNNDCTPIFPSDSVVREIAMRAGIKTITTGITSPGSGKRVAAKVRAMVSAQKIASERCLIIEVRIFINLSFRQEPVPLRLLFQQVPANSPDQERHPNLQDQPPNQLLILDE
jgi:hypothetical protein